MNYKGRKYMDLMDDIGQRSCARTRIFHLRKESVRRNQQNPQSYTYGRFTVIIDDSSSRRPFKSVPARISICKGSCACAGAAQPEEKECRTYESMESLRNSSIVLTANICMRLSGAVGWKPDTFCSFREIMNGKDSFPSPS